MRKTRSLVGKTLLATLILLAISAPFLTSTSAIYIDQIPGPSVYMDPYRVEGTAGTYQTVYMKVSGFTNNAPLFSVQAGLLFDPAKVEISNANVTEGGFLSHNGADTLLAAPGTINNTAGVITPYGWTLTDPLLNKTGGGNLIKFIFHMKVTGYSDIHVFGYTPLDPALYPISTKTIDYFTAFSGDVVKIVGNPESPSGTSVNGYSAHSVSTVDQTINSTTYTGQLNFTITADEAAFAYFNVTIPHGLMWCDDPNQWLVQVNGTTQSARTVFDNASHTTISLEFSYGATPTGIGILSVHIVPEFSTIFFATLLVLATFAAALFGKATWSYKRKG